MPIDLETAACTPVPLDAGGFNTNVQLPFGCTTGHIKQAMEEWLGFLGFINKQLHTRGTPRLETILMPANFSSMVGELMVASIPKFCKTLVKNRYHNGHPDLLPSGLFPGDAAQHCDKGIEVKGSRYLKAWQGHNVEDCWLMVFVFDANGPRDAMANVPPRPFEFLLVLGAQLRKSDWKFAGRSATSRRTITASVTDSGYEKMMANWIYKAPAGSPLKKRR